MTGHVLSRQLEIEKNRKTNLVVFSIGVQLIVFVSSIPSVVSRGCYSYACTSMA